MATQVRGYEFVPDIRRRAEELRMANVRQAVRGSIQAHSITADMMAVGVLNVGSGAVTIDDGVITGDKLAVNTITANEIDVGAVGTDELGDGAITGVKIVDGAVTAGKLTVSTLSAITADMGTLTAGSIIGGTIQSGTGSPQATFSSDGIVLTNARTSEAVNHAPSHVDFYSDGSADSEQKGSLACFVGDSSVNYAPHLTVRALTTDDNHGRASLAIWNGTDALTSMDLFATRALSFWTAETGFTNFAFRDGSTSKISGSWNVGDLSALAFHSLPSDRAAKENIKKLGDTLSVVKKLKPVSYVLKQNGEAKVGFVAEEVKAVLPDAVSQIPTELDRRTGEPTTTASGVDLMQLLTHAIGAVQELATRVEALERK